MTALQASPKAWRAVAFVNYHRVSMWMGITQKPSPIKPDPLMPPPLGHVLTHSITGAVVGGCLLMSAAILAWLSGDALPALLALAGTIIMAVTVHQLAKRLIRAEAQRDAGDVRLALAERGRTELLTNMSHELRTPLNAVIGFSQIMSTEMMGPVGNPIYIDNARAIEDAGMRLLATVNDILDIASVDLSADDMRESAVDLNELLEGLAIVIGGRAEATKVSVTVRKVNNLPRLHADGAYVKQLLSNLLNNAVKFTPPGGQVKISLRQEDDSSLSVTIADTGVGISTADMVRVTQAFTIGESVFTRNYQGQGLGLAIARRLVDLHGGTIDLQSQVDEGTTVTVTFPPDRTILPLP